MSRTPQTWVPRARTEGLVVEKMADETLVYDLETHEAHCLNRSATVVWKHCDGGRTPKEIAQQIAKENGTAVDESLVRFALARLSRAGLLDVPTPRSWSTVSRRDLAKKIALYGGLAILVPSVISVVAPTVAQAASCIGVTKCSGLTEGLCCGTSGLCTCKNGECRDASLNLCVS